MTPFRRGPFRELPERPRLPHAYARTEALDLEIETPVFGRTRAHVRKFGAGPPLLLVHGLMTSSYSFRYAFEPLGQKFTCYAPDLPGAGGSEPALSVRYSPRHLAGWLSALLTKLGIYGAPAIANSMGGYIAMQLVLQEAGAFSRLVNVHSPGVPEWRLQALRLLGVPGAKSILSAVIGRDVRRWVHRNVHYYDESLKSLEEADEYGKPLRTPAGRAALIKYLTETMGLEDMAPFQQALVERKERGLAFPVPLLLLYAKQNPMVPPRFGEVFAARIPSAKLVWLEQASHFAHVDAVERFLPPVLEFLGS